MDISILRELAPSQICRTYHVQMCHVCDDVDCGDNTSPLKATVTRQREALEAYKKYRELCFSIDTKIASGEYKSAFGWVKKEEARAAMECIMNEAIKEAP